MSSKNNVRIYLDATEKRRIKLTRISDVLSVWGTRIKLLDEYNLTGAIQFVLYVALLSEKIAGIKFVSNATYKQGLRYSFPV